jgi:hypothetical protein
MTEASNSLLIGWKEIAAFIKHSECAARRLAKEEGMPVFKTKGNVMASKKAIEVWVLENSIRK